MSGTGCEGRAGVVLLSGGLDSATVLALAREQGYRPFCLSLDYGQRHDAELDAARRVAEALGAEEHRVVAIDLSGFGGSALTSESIEVPRGREVEAIGDGIPVTYVPARNTVFLSLALAWAEVLGARDLFIGVNALDYSGYPDCRPAFVYAFEALANLATKSGVEGGATGERMRVHAPLVQMTKAEIVARGTELGVDYGMTVSCYAAAADGAACGDCDACVLRQRGFEGAGLPDPTRYAARGDADAGA